jgi:FkbM family methyltransferase
VSRFADQVATHEPRFLADWLGVTMRQQYIDAQMFGDVLQAPLLGDVYEWQTLARAIEGAKSRFTMLELGAGFGRWTVNAAAALRRFRPDLRYRFVAVEAEPTHFRWLRAHTRENGLWRWSRRGTCRLVRAAVSSRSDGREQFYVGDSARWYGQALVRPENAGFVGQTVAVPTVTLGALLERFDATDLVDMDIEGAELEVLEEAAPLLGRVKHLFVETHGDETHTAVRSLVGRTHELVANAPPGSTQDTPFGEATFDGGVLTFRQRNPD